MDLIVKMPSIAEAIECNFEEVKAWLSERCSYYEKAVYSDDGVKTAKSDRATINKLIKSLKDEKSRAKAECLKPYTDFETKVNELITIAEGAKDTPDKYIKATEEKRKKDKMDQIKEVWDRQIDKPDWLKCKAIFNDKWLNATYSIKTIGDDIEKALATIKADLDTLSELPEFGFEAVEVYKQTLDMNRAVSEAKRMSEIQKQKEAAEKAKVEAEEKAKQVATEKIQKETEQETVRQSVLNENLEVVPEQKQEPEATRWLAFKCKLTRDDAVALRRFFVERNITYKQIQEV